MDSFTIQGRTDSFGVYLSGSGCLGKQSFGSYGGLARVIPFVFIPILLRYQKGKLIVNPSAFRKN